MAASTGQISTGATAPGVDPPSDDRDEERQDDGQLRGQLAMDLAPAVPESSIEPPYVER